MINILYHTQSKETYINHVFHKRRKIMVFNGLEFMTSGSNMVITCLNKLLVFLKEKKIDININDINQNGLISRLIKRKLIPLLE